MKAAIDLIWRTFLEYEAPDYTDDGIKEFERTINDEEWMYISIWVLMIQIQNKW